MNYLRGTYKPKTFDPTSSVPFRLSRSKIDLFIRCPRCFYLDRRLGIQQPSGPPFTLNSAVDKLLKKEFDIHRAKGQSHPLMKTYGIDAIPFAHEELNTWRDNFKGIRFYHQPTNFIITGAIDDIWINPKGEVMIVDYKSTSKSGEITLDDEWKDTYKRQAEVYQWLFRKNSFRVSKLAYFVYCNGDTDKSAFDGKLEFSVKILPYAGDDSWVEGTIGDARRCLVMDKIPARDKSCEFCNYTQAILEVSQPQKVIRKNKKNSLQPLLFE